MHKLPRANPFIVPRFVGRLGWRGEMICLTEELERARQGHARTVIVDGQAGVGKSRVLNEFRQLVLSANCLALRLSLRESRTPSALLRSLASNLASCLSGRQKKIRESILKQIFATGATGVATWITALGEGWAIAPPDPVALGVWAGAGTIVVPLLAEALKLLGSEELRTVPTDPHIGLTEILDGLQHLNEYLGAQPGHLALVLIFDQWDQAKMRVPIEKEAFEDIAVALSERVREWENRRVLPIFGVRSEARAETIGQLHNALNTWHLLINPLPEDACLDLLTSPLGATECRLSFTEEAAKACVNDCRGNAEHLVLLASEMWEAALAEKKDAISLPLYRERAPREIAQLVASRVERFLKGYREWDQEARTILRLLADEDPSHHWTPEELHNHIEHVRYPEMLRDMLEALAKPDIALLVHHAEERLHPSYYVFQHDLRWQGLWQWVHPGEVEQRRDELLALRKLRDWVRSRGAMLGNMQRIEEYLRLGIEAQALGESRISTDAVTALTELLEHRTDGVVREAAAKALGRIGSLDAVQALVNHLKRQTIWAWPYVPAALAQAGSQEAVKALIEAAESDNRLVWQAAGRAIATINSPESTPILVEALKHLYVRVRLGATKALGNIATRAAVDAIVIVLDDDMPTVRQAAITALRNIADRADSQNGVRHAAHEALVRAGLHKER